MGLEQEFLNALSGAGITPTHNLILDGQLRRYHVYGDKRGRRNGWYRYIRVADDYAMAVYGSNKLQLSARWSSHENGQITSYHKKLLKKQQKENEETEQMLQARAAQKANAYWVRSKPIETHVYAQNKGVAVYGLREMHNALVVPMFINNYLVSLQFIMPDGGKRYLTGGQKRGAYYSIGELGIDKKIYICEGYATAASIHAATGALVIVAFDAGNLIPVAEAIRAVRTDARIIMAGDNDQWTAGNPGKSKAQEAADKVGGTVMVPDFDYQDKKCPTDWNDFHQKHGIKALADQLAEVSKTAVITQQQINERVWQRSLMPGKEILIGHNEFDPKSKENAYIFMANHQDFIGIMAYNDFSDEVIIYRCPPWEDPKEFMPRRVADTDASMYVRFLERTCHIKTNKEIVVDYMQVLAKKNRINPPRDYFESLRWDGTYRMRNWLAYYLGAEKQNPVYLEAIGMRWMIAAVTRIYRPGAKFDHVLTLEGAQGIRKTTALRTLATFNLHSYFLEFSGHLGHKDTPMLMQGKIIVEMSELASVRKTETEEMKAFLSKQEDEYRPPYAKNTITRPRRFIFGASTNSGEEDEYLVDTTGSRRIWAVKCGDNIDIEALERDREQLWAEAVAAYRSGAQIWLSEEEEVLARQEQEKRKAVDIMAQDVDRAAEKVLFMSKPLTIENIVEEMNFPIGNKPKNLKSRIIDCMKGLGYNCMRAYTDTGARPRIWKK